MNYGSVAICMWPLLDIPLIHLVADVAQVNVLPFVPRGSGGVDGIAFEFVHRLSKPFNISFTSRYTSSPHSPSHRGTRVVTDRPGSKSDCIRVEDVYAGVIKSEPIQVGDAALRDAHACHLARSAAQYGDSPLSPHSSSLALAERMVPVKFRMPMPRYLGERKRISFMSEAVMPNPRLTFSTMALSSLIQAAMEMVVSRTANCASEITRELMIMASALSSTCLKLSSLSRHKTCSHREAPVADESGISVRARTPKDLIIQCSRSNAAIASVLSSVMLRSHSGLGKKWALKGIDSLIIAPLAKLQA